MKISDDFKLNVVSVRLVKEAPILSDIKISNPEAAVQFRCLENIFAKWTEKFCV